MPREVQVHITAKSFIVAILFGLLMVALWYLRDIVLILLTGVVIASAMEPGIRWFVRYKVPRILAVILMYLLVAAAVILLLIFFIPLILNDVANFLTQLPDLLGSIDFSQSSSNSILPLKDISSLLSSANFVRSFSETIGGSTASILNVLGSIFGSIVTFALIVVFSFYFCVQDTGVEDFLRIITPPSYHAYVVNLWKRAQDKIGKWIQGQLLLGLLVGVLLYLGLLILGVPYALFLAVVAGCFELIPVFGQILAAIPAIAIAFSAGGWSLAILVAGLFIIVQQFESNLIYPLVVKKIVGLPPLLVILALLVGGKLAGFIGVLLAVPIAAAVREFVADFTYRRTKESASLAKVAESPLASAAEEK